MTLLDPNRPYPEGVAWDEAWRQRQRADKLERVIKELAKELSHQETLSIFGRKFQHARILRVMIDMLVRVLEVAK